jgi:hypothetical protein
MIVRELITLLGFSVDRSSYDKAAKAYDQMQGKMAQGAQTATKQAQLQAQQTSNVLGQALGMAQRFAAQFQLSSMLRGFVTMASDANETTNALAQLFGPAGQAQVEAWSQTMGATMGRSQYDLQMYASRLGSVLGPVTKSREEAQRMAQSLSELSVDLASFFNTSDEQAMMALRSGLTGEYESLKRFGVVLNDATLAEVAHARGIKKKVTQMTVAEKTELRYAAIIERTKAAQGDAARTGDGFANASKALAAGLKDVGIKMAKTVIPMAERLVRWARDAVTWFNKVASQSRVLESAFIALAGVAAVLALEFYGAFILPAAAVAALILLIDEVWTTLKGGDTYLRKFLDAMLGAENAEAAIQKLREAFEYLQKLDAQGIWETFAMGADLGAQAVGRLAAKFAELIPGLKLMKEAFETAHAAAKFMTGHGDDAEGRTKTQGMGAQRMTEAEHRAAREAEQLANIAAGSAARKEERTKREHAASQYQVTPGGPLAFPMPMGGEGYGVLAAPIAAGAGQPAQMTVTFGAPVVTIVNPKNTAETEQAVTTALVKERKTTAAAIGGRGRQ